jgi:putative restriction endonuclease
MKYYVGITDEEWYRFLAAKQPDEVNFWRPMAKTAFKAIPPGAPFLFKLHMPKHYIVGGGWFAGYTSMPLRMAWDAFREQNGSPNFAHLHRRIEHYRSSRNLETVDPEIGCIVLTRPFFFDERDWIDAPASWRGGIVQGKGFNTDEPEGLALWTEVDALLRGSVISGGASVVREVPAEYGPVFGKEYLRAARLGQGAFRALILEQYKRTCCITGETTLPVLQAAHILPVTHEGDHRLTNGLLMRADMHILFDLGLIGVSPDHKVQVSPHIHELYTNGKVYYAYQDQPLKSLPDDIELQPDKDALDWHLTHVFRA